MRRKLFSAEHTGEVTAVVLSSINVNGVCARELGF